MSGYKGVYHENNTKSKNYFYTIIHFLVLVKSFLNKINDNDNAHELMYRAGKAKTRNIYWDY